jgi:hypothetical protein
MFLNFVYWKLPFRIFCTPLLEILVLRTSKCGTTKAVSMGKSLSKYERVYFQEEHVTTFRHVDVFVSVDD